MIEKRQQKKEMRTEVDIIGVNKKNIFELQTTNMYLEWNLEWKRNDSCFYHRYIFNAIYQILFKDTYHDCHY